MQDSIFLQLFSSHQSIRFYTTQNLPPNNILASEPYGFRSGMSTDNAAYKLTESILKAWNKYMYVRGMFCDLTNAFDCVHHEIFLLKLQHYDIQGVNAD